VATVAESDLLHAETAGREGRTATYAVSALRFGTALMPRAAAYAGYDATDAGRTQQLDFFLWAMTSGSECVLFDTGFNEPAGTRRGRTMVADPIELLADLGIAPGDVSTVVISHFHYDHIGNLARFPRARLVAQRAELEFWRRNAGRERREQLNGPVDDADLAVLEQAGAEGRLVLLDGDGEVRPGIVAHRVGGHTPGSQLLNVPTDSGELILAADALHLYDELETARPFPVLVDLERTFDAFDLLRDYQARPATTVVAGHDPKIMHLFPPSGHGADSFAVSLSQGLLPSVLKGQL
jgi:glyoxylase-like metal-dependent hydrolase (beta-lactamase superfamily II)